jgi:hypothetical protein
MVRGITPPLAKPYRGWVQCEIPQIGYLRYMFTSSPYIDRYSLLETSRDLDRPATNQARRCVRSDS